MSKILEKLAISQIVKCIELENVLPKLVRLCNVFGDLYEVRLGHLSLSSLAPLFSSL